LVRNYGALSAILLLGAFLRVYQLGTESLWRDEGWTLWFANLGSPSEIVKQSETDNNFPTYYLILRYWVALFGDSEFSVRFPSALAGILAIFAIYKVGDLLFGRGAALMASLILALSLFHVSYSQEARVYEPMALLALLSFYFLLKVLKKRNPTALTGYILFTSALMYCHVYGLFIVLGQNIYYFAAAFLGKVFGQREEARLGLGGWILLQALLLVLYVPGLVLLVGWIASPTGRTWIVPPSLNSVYADFVTYSGSPWLLILLLTFSLFAVVGLIRSGAGGKLYLLLAWLVTPVVLPIAISVFSTPIFVNRYAIVATPALYLLAAKGVEVASGAFSRVAFPREIPRVLKANTASLIVAATLIVLSSGVLWDYFNLIHKVQWREAALSVDAHAQTDDLILVYPPRALPVFDHYSERTDAEKEPLLPPAGATNLERAPFLPPDGATPTIQSIEKHGRVWVVHDLKTTPKADDRLFPHTLLQKSHNLIYIDKRYAGLSLTLYEKK
jgi:uncharacterized membrane protein